MDKVDSSGCRYVRELYGIGRGLPVRIFSRTGSRESRGQQESRHGKSQHKQNCLAFKFRLESRVATLKYLPYADWLRNCYGPHCRGSPPHYFGGPGGSSEPVGLGALAAFWLSSLSVVSRCSAASLLASSLRPARLYAIAN